MDLCSKTNCNSGLTPDWMPILKVWPKGMEQIEQNAIRIPFNLPLCQKCKEDAVPSDFLTDEGWDRICSVIKQMGGQKPNRDSVVLHFRLNQ